MAHEKTASLVLLPAPPASRSPESLSAAYRPALETALQKTSSPSRPAMLVVAVAYPLAAAAAGGLVWNDAQELLAGLYSLLVVLSKALHIETGMDDGPGSVDARVVLLRSGSSPSSSSSCDTVLVDVATFAAAATAHHRTTAWDSIFYPDSKAGRQLRDQYHRASASSSSSSSSDTDLERFVAVSGGLPLAEDTSDEALLLPPPSSPTTLHKTVCLGGTFDYLHPGHKLLLTAGALLLRVPSSSSSASSPPPANQTQQCEYVIGITGDELLRNKKYAELVQPWSQRAQAVVDFLATILELPSDAPKGSCNTLAKDGELRATFRSGTIAVLCVRINNAYGPTIEREDISCLVVSGETRAGGEAVNQKRGEQGWPLLETFVVSVLNADGMAAEAAATATESFDAKISSSAIRKRRAEQAAAAR